MVLLFLATSLYPIAAAHYIKNCQQRFISTRPGEKDVAGKKG